METGINKTIKHKISKRRTFKKMNCNPKIDGKTPIKDSCLTPDILVKIAKEFNNHHKSDPIQYNDYIDLWKKLKNRLNHCDKEDCWLEQIKDIELRKQIDKMAFAPDKPLDWKKNPRAWLSNFDIMKVLRQYEDIPFQGKYKFKLLGPSPIDFDSKPIDMNGECVWQEICNFDLKFYLDKGKTKIGIVFNLDKHTQGGSHWVSLFIDLKDKFIFYLDSNGDKIKKQIYVLVKRIIEQGKSLEHPIIFEFYENYPREHQKQNTECGMYSLFFIITMLTNKAGPKKFRNVKDKINFFKNKTIPDNYVFNYRNKYFND
jgi:hypothetical protein